MFNLCQFKKIKNVVLLELLHRNKVQCLNITTYGSHATSLFRVFIHILVEKPSKDPVVAEIITSNLKMWFNQVNNNSIFNMNLVCQTHNSTRLPFSRMNDISGIPY